VSLVKKRVFWIIFFVVFIDLVGFGIVFPLLPLYARQFQMSEFQIGIVLGIYSLMQFIFAPILGRLSDRVGRRPVLLVSMLGTAVSFFMLAWSHNFWWFFIARALDGIAGSNLATAQAYIADISPKEQRTRNLGMWIGAAFGLGFAFGPFLGGGLHLLGQMILPQAALSFPFLVAGAIALINAVFGYFMLPESLKIRDSEHHIGRRTFSWSIIHEHVGAAVGPLIITYAVVIFAFAQMEATFTWISNDLFKLPHIAIYALFGYLGIVMSIVQGGVVRRLAPKMGDKNLAVIGCALMVVGLATLPMFHNVLWLLLTSGLLAAGESFANPALISSISKGSNDYIQGETMGVTQSLASLSRFLGPLAAGYFYQYLGKPSPYFISAIIMLLAILLCQAGFKRLMAHPENEGSVSA
jgi:MFS transporter, DHA1 family, tetracycline resistance protein